MFFQILIRLCNLQRLCQNFHYDDAARKSIKPHSQPQYLNKHLGQQVRLARLLSNSHKRILGDKMNQTASVGKLFYESFHWCNCPCCPVPNCLSKQGELSGNCLPIPNLTVRFILSPSIRLCEFDSNLAIRQPQPAHKKR